MPFDARPKELARAHDAVNRLRERKKMQEARQQRIEARFDVIVRGASVIALGWLVYWSWLQLTALP